MKFFERMVSEICYEKSDYDGFGISETVERLKDFLQNELATFDAQKVLEESGYKYEGMNEADIIRQKRTAIGDLIYGDKIYEKFFNDIDSAIEQDFRRSLENILYALIAKGNLNAIKSFRDFMIDAEFIDEDFENSL